MTDITPTGFIKAVFAMPVIGALGSAVEVYGAISVLSTAMDLSDSEQAEADNVKEARKSNPCPKHK